MSDCASVLWDPKVQLILSELLDIVGWGRLGLGPPGSFWKRGFHFQLCHVLAPSSPASVYAPE